MERYQHVSFDFAVVQPSYQQQKSGYKLTLRANKDPYPFNWYKGNIEVEFKLLNWWPGEAILMRHM